MTYDETPTVDGGSNAAAAGEGSLSQKQRLQALLKEVAVKQAEIDSLRVLTRENAFLREQNNALRSRLATYEEERTRPVVDGTVLDLRVRLQAYQKHSTYLQNQLLDKEAMIRGLKEKIDILSEDLSEKHQQFTGLVERLKEKSGNHLGETTDFLTVSDDPESFGALRAKIKQQEHAQSVVREAMESLQEDLQRREMVLEAVQRENAMLRKSVSRLIDQVHTNMVAGTVEEAEPLGSRNISIGSGPKVQLPAPGPDFLGSRTSANSDPRQHRELQATHTSSDNGLLHSQQEDGGLGDSNFTLAIASRDDPSSRLKAYRMNKIISGKPTGDGRKAY